MSVLRRSFPLCFWVLMLVVLGELYGQEFRGSLLGSVRDASGAVVPGATVAAINVETNISTSTVSGEIGNYRIPFLLPGNYRVIVELSGFRRLERNSAPECSLYYTKLNRQGGVLCDLPC